jgi:hypothetical protein
MDSSQSEKTNRNDDWLNRWKGLRGATMKKVGLLACLGILAMLVAASPIQAQAAATLTLYDGVNPLITVVDNGPGDQLGVTGAILVKTNVGVWNLAISTAVTKPLLGSTIDPVMELNLQANALDAGSLRLVFSDDGFGPATGLVNAIVDGQIVDGAAATVTYDVWGDPANVVGATTVHIASAGTMALPTSATGSGPLGLPTPFSLTQVETLIASGATTLDSDASFQVVPVPEPTGIALAGLGLAACVLGRFQRSRTQPHPR